MTEMYGDRGPQKTEHKELRGTTQGYGSLASELDHFAKLGWTVIAVKYGEWERDFECPFMAILQRDCKTPEEK